MIRKSNPDSPVGETEDVAVEVAAPDGSVTQVVAEKPAGEAVTVTTPEVSVTSAPAGSNTAVMKSYDDGLAGFEQAAQELPLYKSLDGTLYYKETEAKMAEEIDKLKADKKRKEDEAAVEKAYNLYPNAPKHLVRHLVKTGASAQAFKELQTMSGQASVLSKQFGSPVDDSTAGNSLETLISKEMEKDDEKNGKKKDYNVALTKVLQTSEGRAAWAEANPHRPVV